eukprot:scaffold294542_cov17-Tisochrysis_lutea.AAC.1
MRCQLAWLEKHRHCVQKGTCPTQSTRLLISKLKHDVRCGQTLPGATLTCLCTPEAAGRLYLSRQAAPGPPPSPAAAAVWVCHLRLLFLEAAEDTGVRPQVKLTQLLAFK